MKGTRSLEGRTFLVLFLILLIPIAVYGAGATEAAEVEPLPVRLAAILWGNVPVDEELVQDAINERLKADGVNVSYHRNWIDFGGGTTWQQKTNLMLSTGEEFELLSIIQDRWPVSMYVGQGAAHPVGEYLDEYGPAVKEGIPGYLKRLNEGSKDGHLKKFSCRLKTLNYPAKLSR